MVNAVSALAEEVRRHKLDTMSQDSGQQCVCGSDSRFEQKPNDLIVDPPWKDVSEHVAQRIVGILAGMTAAVMEHEANR